VRPVEGVPGEELDLVEDRLRGYPLHAVLHAPVHELLPRLLHHLRRLLAHRLAQRVGRGQREAGHLVRDPHDLFLINANPVSVLEDRLQLRMLIFDLELPVPAPDEVVHHPGAQRPGAEQRHQRDQILEPLGLQLADQVPHPARLQLENSGAFPGGQHGVGLRVIHRDLVEVERDPPLMTDQLGGLVEHRQRPQPQEVHLQQPDLLHRLHREPGADLPLRGFDQRHVVGEVPVGDHHAGRVGGGVPREPLQRHRGVQQLADARVLLVQGLQRSGTISIAFFSVIPNSNGIILAILSASG